MKKMILTFSMGLLIVAVHGQQTQGRIVYERTVQLKMDFQGMGDEAGHAMPTSHKEKLEVLFGNNQSLRRAVEEDAPDEMAEGPGGGMHIRMDVAGDKDIIYNNFSTGQSVEQREFGPKNYIITDSIPHLHWKLTGETTTILNYPCQQAITQRIGKRREGSMENGEMKSREVADTANIIAWFTPTIPVPAGPELQGQLPGLILGLDVHDGRVVYKAIEVAPQTELSAIKAPSRGKKVTANEFEAEREKMIAEMQKNAGKGRNMIRIGG